MQQIAMLWKIPLHLLPERLHESKTDEKVNIGFRQWTNQVKGLIVKLI